MKTSATKPLSHLLTRRMIRVQLVTLALFFGVILLMIIIAPLFTGGRNFAPPDPSVLSAIEDSLHFSEAGTLELTPSSELRELGASYPNLWFIAGVPDGSTEVQFGTPPAEALAIRDNFSNIVSLQLMVQLEHGTPSVLVRTIDIAGGAVRVALGGGPALGVSAIIQAVTIGLMVTTFIVLAIASAVAIPRFIQREMQGLSAAAGTAESIDVDQRGLRIAETGLPAEVLTLVRAVNEALERLDEAHSRRERFLAAAAHELRTPIAVILARIETAAPFAERDRLLADVARLRELTDQLLDVQRLTLSEPTFEPVDLVDLGAGIVADLAPLAISAGYELELDAPTDPVRVEADPGSLYRALTNLVRNAISHAGNRGRIVVTVRAPNTISVGDDGPGIPVGEERRIFEPFHRAERSSDGAGLGLSLVESIVRRHRATIAVGRSATGGAHFVIRFPTRA